MPNDHSSENFYSSKQAQQLVNLRVQQGRISKNSKYFHQFNNCKDLDKQVQFNERLRTQNWADHKTV